MSFDHNQCTLVLGTVACNGVAFVGVSASVFGRRWPTMKKLMLMLRYWVTRQTFCRSQSVVAVALVDFD